VNVLLVPLGSHGDIHPFVGIGLGLRARGHRVRMIVNPFFAPLVEGVGLELIPLGTADEYRRLNQHPDLWHRTRGTRLIFSLLGSFIRPMYRLIAEHCTPGETVMAASTLALGARVAQDRLGIPTATIHLQPTVIRSAIAPAKVPGVPMAPWVPPWVRRAIYFAADRLVIDPLLAPPLNSFRREIGLDPVRRVMDYWHSPQRVIGLWPQWFAPPQPDWPQQVRLTGFPLYDERGFTKLPDELVAFLNGGDQPIAFTPGSAMWNGRRFFEQSIAACQLLGRRGLLLTRHYEHVPANLPSTVRHIEYAPFSELLPRCDALVHHGGIGTCAQALAAGVPQLVMPNAHDQPDNAARLVRLGVARIIEPQEYRPAIVARALAELLDSSEVRNHCDSAKTRLRGAEPLGPTCDLIEQLRGSRGGYFASALAGSSQPRFT